MNFRFDHARSRRCRRPGTGWWTTRTAWNRLLVMCLLLSGCGMAGQGSAWANSASVSSIEIGFQGTYKVGYWTPVWVTIEAKAEPVHGQLRLTTLDGDGVPISYQDDAAEPLSLDPGTSRRVLRYVKFGRIKSDLVVELTSDDDSQIVRRFAAGEFATPKLANHYVALTVGPPIGTGDITVRQNNSNATRLVHTPQLQDADGLPNHWLGYEGIDTLVLTTADNPVLESASDAQFAAISEWVRLGGKLIVTVGERGEELLGGEPSTTLKRAQQFLPGQIEAVTQLRNAAAIESFTGSSQGLQFPAAGLPITMLSSIDGRVELAATGVRGVAPLIVTSGFGLGQVTFVAFDVDQPPFTNWEGRSRLVARLFRGEIGADQQRTEEQRRRVTHVGYTDLAGQLRSALDQFTGLSLVPFFWVAGLIFVYILLIGPGDYFLLSRLLGRMSLTWITFPLITVAFGIIAVALYQHFKLDELRVNQVDLLDVDLASRQIRGTTWADVYSPHTETYDLNWTPNDDVDGLATSELATVFSWQGLPGTGLGGLNSSAAPPVFTDPYVLQRGPLRSQLVHTPIQVAATKSFQGRWWGEYKEDVASELAEDADGLLTGEIANPLPFELTDCVVLYSNWLYRLERQFGTLAPRQSVRIERERPLNLEWRLTRRRVEETRDVSTPWNQSDLDVPRIVEMMMFHSAAGGDGYTQLTHQYQSYTDLSFHLGRNRAVLMGRAARPAMDLAIDGASVSEAHDKDWTFCRVIFPVTAWKSSQDPLDFLRRNAEVGN